MLTQEDWTLISDYIHHSFGLKVPDVNRKSVQHFILDRLKNLNIPVSDYIQRIKSDKTEYHNFLDIITINETYFFREQKHFQLLSKTIIPGWIKQGQRNLSIWSAGCSSGEEALSLYALLASALPDGWTFKIHASDVNNKVLQRFKQGDFKLSSFRGDGASFHHLLDQIGERKQESFQVKDIKRFQKQIEIKQLNLGLDCFDNLPQMDLVFFRNTLIYLPPKQRADIMEKLFKVLKENALLFLGISEVPIVSHPSLQLSEEEGTFYFQKITNNPSRQNLPQKAELNRQQEKSAVVKNTLEKSLEPKTPSSAIKATTPQTLKQDHQSGKSKARQKTEDQKETLPCQSWKELCTALCTDKDNQERANSVNQQQLEDLEKVIQQIDEGQLAEGIKVLEKNTLPRELLLYLKAYLYLAQQRKEESLLLLDHVLEYDPSFWLAQFRKSQLLEAVNRKEALFNYENCMIKIEEYISSGGLFMHCLLDGFHPKYFLEICRNQIERLRRSV